MKRSDVLAIVVFVLLVGIFFHKTLVSGLLPVPSDTLVGLYHPYRDLKAAEYPNGIPYKNFLITDPIRQQIPWRKQTIDAMKNGTLPTWDATSFSGTPLLANIQSGALYPLNILFFVLPFPLAWSALIISQTLLAGIFFYIFMRIISMGAIPSLFGSIIFAFSGSSIAWLTWGTLLSSWMWTPLALASVHELILHDTKKSVKWFCLGIIALSFSFFAGHLQMFFYSAVTVVLYALWLLNAHRKPHALTWLTAVVLGAVAIVSYQLLAILQWLPQTARLSSGSAWHAEGFFIPFVHLVQFVAPDFFGNPATLNYWGTWNYGEMVGYMGIAGLVFALLGIGKQTKFWGMLAVASLVFAVQSPISALPYVLHLPFLSSLQPTRLLVIVNLALSVLATYGVSSVLTSHKKNYTPVILVGALLAACWVAFVDHSAIRITIEQAQVLKRNLYVPSVVFVSTALLFAAYRYFKKRQLHMGIVILFMALSVFDLFRFGWKFTPFTEQSLFFPRTKVISYMESAPKPFRTMTLDDRILPPDTNTYYGLESINGYDPIHSLRYDKFIAAMERGEPNINPPYGYERIIVPKNTSSPLFDLLNVKYILTFNEIPNPRFRKVLTEGQTHVYENMSLMPRAYLVSRVIYKKTEQEVINALYSPDFYYAFDAVVETPVNVLNTGLQAGESATITHYEQGKMTINVKTTQPRLLVIGNMYNPNWKATVDGKQAPIIRVNYLFMGIYLKLGDNKVSIAYK